MPLSSSDLNAIKNLIHEGVAEVTEPHFQAIAEDFRNFRHELTDHRAETAGLKEEFQTLKGQFSELKVQFSAVTSSLDLYLRRTQAWWQESQVFTHQHQRLTKALLTKNIITEKDLHAQNL